MVIFPHPHDLLILPPEVGTHSRAALALALALAVDAPPLPSQKKRRRKETRNECLRSQNECPPTKPNLHFFARFLRRNRGGGGQSQATGRRDEAPAREGRGQRSAPCSRRCTAAAILTPRSSAAAASSRRTATSVSSGCGEPRAKKKRDRERDDPPFASFQS